MTIPEIIETLKIAKAEVEEFLIKQGVALVTKRMANSFNMLGENLKKQIIQLDKLKENIAFIKKGAIQNDNKENEL